MVTPVFGQSVPGPTAAAATAPAVVSAATLAANKKLLLDFFAFRGSFEDRGRQFLADDYVQHNPRFLAMDKVTGARGRQAWVAAQQEAQRQRIRIVDLNGISLRAMPVILMAEGDLVTAVYRGEMADPTTVGRMQEIFAFETVRIRDGKFVEHWDQVTLAVDWMTPSTAPLPVPTPPLR